MDIQSVLLQILKEVQTKPNSLCVFDLDSTLICVKKRTQKILQALAEDSYFRQNHPGPAKMLKDIEIDPNDFNLKTMFKRARLKLSDSLYQKIFLYWTTHFFSNDYLHCDTLYPGVSSYLSSLQGAEIMYLTGRCDSLMRKGTLFQLRKWNLPLKKESHLMMKPNNYTEDAYFKKCYLDNLSKKYKPIWFFENEPVVINFVNKFLKDIHVVFVNSVHSHRQNVNKNIHTILADYS